MQARLKQKKIDIHFTSSAVQLLGMLGFDPNFGARPVKRVIQQMVENQVALGVLKGYYKEDESVLIDANLSPEVRDVGLPNRLLITKIDHTSPKDETVAAS